MCQLLCLESGHFWAEKKKGDTVHFRSDKSHFTIVVALEEECSGETDDTGADNCHKGSFVFVMGVVGHSVESELNGETKRWGQTFSLSLSRSWVCPLPAERPFESEGHCDLLYWGRIDFHSLINLSSL